ncbi:hypothetical protein PF008_g13540 [Phytophthora fragariae]|uniref:C2H2-type domain-containing protein n=1 Tax=Phytophthora fragariae TaxID=53985 RepID=A0A6G0RJS2_9STRA|nr:hypothetical protein PF008_g13540 [Phytophthora fragariae]
MATEEAVSNLGAVASPKPMQEFFPVRQVLGMLQRNERLGEKPPPPLIAPAKPKELQENQDSNTPDTREEIVAESPPSQQDDVSQDPSDPVRGDAAGTLLCFKCGKAFLSATSLRTHLATDYPCNERLSVTLPQGEGKTESKTCFKCGKTFASWQGLRGHLNRIKPCDQEKSAPTTIRRRTAASRTCAKCGKTFSSAQSLRIHMNRVKPCDQDKLSVSTPTTPPATTPPTTPLMMNEEELKKEAERKARARYQARKAYLKKRGRLGELGDPPTLFYISKRNGQGAENETMLKPDLKRSAPEDPSEESDKVDASSDENKRPRVEEKESQEDESTDSPSDVSGLIQANNPTAQSSNPVLAQPLIHQTTQPNTPTPPQSVLGKTILPTASAPAQSVFRKAAPASGGSFKHRSNKRHGGDLLAGGCSCPPCVRRWARKLVNRMQQLEDEVLTLRQRKPVRAENGSVRGASADKPTAGLRSNESMQRQPVVVEGSLPSPANTGASSNSSIGVAGGSLAKPAEIFRALAKSSSASTFSQRPERMISETVVNQGSNELADAAQFPQNGGCSAQSQQNSTPAASFLMGLGSDKRSLIDAYSHMNDQILLNERTVEDSTSHVQILMGIDQGAAMDFRKQIAELRMSISAEKSKRDITVATLIAHEWKPRRDEFKGLLERTEVQDSPNEEQSLHAKWSEIAEQVSLKDKAISDFEKQMDSLGEAGDSSRSRYAEMGELSSKMAAEYAAKMSLESERESVYLDLVKSSTRIRALVRNALLR